MNKLTSIAATVALAAVSLMGQNGGPKETAPVVVHKIHGAPPGLGTGGTGTTGNGINYNGGPVMLNGINMYYIYFGNWSGHPNAPTVLNNFANNIGGSPYFNINTTYFDSTNTNVKNQVALAGSVTSSYTAANPTNLTFGDIFGIVSRAFTNDGLAPDPNGVYFVLTAPGVTQSNGSGSSFLSQYCGWHTASTYNGTWIKYAFIGDANGTYGCTGPISNPDPTQDLGAYAMASVIAHELEESTTDPLISAWYNSGNQENADLCAWTFGPAPYTAPNGAIANMNLGGHDFMIQQNWVNANGGSCVLSYASAPDYNLKLTTSSSVSVLPGNGGTYGIGINAVGGFNSSVNLSVTGLPTGASGTFSPNPMTTTSTLSVTTTTSITPATYPLTISGVGGGLTRTIAATLIVTPPPAPDFTLSVSPSTQTVTQGNPTSAYNVTVNPTNGFSGSVTLSIITSLPAGVGASFTSGAPNAPGTVTLSTLASTPAGSYPFTIQGVGGGKTHVIGATLVVNSVGSYSITISPNPLTIKRPGSGVYTVTVTPTPGFKSPVTLTIAGLPSKVSASSFTVNPVPTTSGLPQTSQITITANKNVQATKTNATVTVTGKGGNLSFFGTAQLSIQ